MGEILSAGKDEKIAELIAIRAGLSVISQNSDEIKAAEDRLFGLNIDKCKYINKQIDDYQLLVKEYNDKISEIENDMEKLSEEKYAIASIENGNRSLYQIKLNREYEDYDNYEDFKRRRKPEFPFGIFATLFFVLLFIASCVVGVIYDKQDLNVVYYAVIGGWVGVFGFAILKIIDKKKSEYRKKFAVFHLLSEFVEEKRQYEKARKEYLAEQKTIDVYEERYKREAPLITMQKRHELAALNKEKEIELPKKRERDEKERAAFEVKTDNEIQKVNEEIKACAKESECVAKALSEKYPWFSESDWENTDLVLYYLQTGRADNVKEALYQVDRERQTERITQAVSQAAKYVAGVVGRGFDSLRETVREGLEELVGTVRSGEEYMQGVMRENAERVNEQLESARSAIKIQRELLSETQLNNALLEKANETSDELLNDLRYQQKYWVK